MARAQDILEHISKELMNDARKIDEAFNVSEWYGFSDNDNNVYRMKYIADPDSKQKYNVYKGKLDDTSATLYVAFRYEEDIYVHLIETEKFDMTQQNPKVVYLKNDIINGAKTKIKHNESLFIQIQLGNETVESINRRIEDNLDVDSNAIKKLLDAEAKCAYCGVTQQQLNLLWDQDDGLTKRSRGHKMEVDRIEPNGGYTNGNILLSCYWCNNAKTDTFSLPEFQEIAKGINAVWKMRLPENEKVIFPNHTYEKYDG